MKYLFNSLLAITVFAGCARDGLWFRGNASEPQPLAHRVEITDPQTPESREIYGPSIDKLPTDAKRILNVEFTRTPQGPLFLDLYLPGQAKGRYPLLIWIHGGGWHVAKDSRLQFLPARVVGRNYVLASIGYRDSNQAHFPAQVQDCKAAIRFLRAHARQYHIDPKRIGVWGVSAGGHLAVLIGTSGGVAAFEGDGGNAHFSSRVAAVCNFSGPADLSTFEGGIPAVKQQVPKLMQEFLGELPKERPDLVIKASPITYADPTDPPFLIMHGDADPLVEVDQAVRLYEVLQSNRVEVTLAIVKGGGHVFWGPEVDREIDAFFDKHLKPSRVKN
jgi:acetyl esterase/lipase